MATYLSKTNYIRGLQCPKLLWHEIHNKSDFAETSKASQHLFDQGKQVGDLAKKRFPEGIECYHSKNDENIKITKEALKKRKPLFEAGVNFGSAYARADILVPVKNGWDIIEVKSASNIKDVHIEDVAYQYYVFSKAGIKINKCYLMTINGEYVRKGEIDVEKLFSIDEIDVDITGIKKEVDDMLKVINSKTPPKKDIGSYCDSPYVCPLHNVCWKHIPKNSVFDLGGSKKCWELYNRGILKIKDIPLDVKLTPKMEIQLETVKSGKPHIEKKVIKDFLKRLKYPLYYFDFETFSTAVPLYDGLKPYRQIPFQYSLHVVDKKGKVKHYSYLCLENKDPRPDMLKALKEQIGTKGSIISYFASFEMTRLLEMGKAFPKYKKWIDSLLPRFVDLLDVFKNFECYYPSQGSTASLKYVLPAFTGKDYSDMEIGNGSDATLAYLSVVEGKITGNNIKTVRKDLERYCGQDTEGMIWIVEKLRKIK